MYAALPLLCHGRGALLALNRPSCLTAMSSVHSSLAALQDNWFVLAAVMRDQYGILLDIDPAGRPGCSACQRTNMTLVLTKCC